MKALNTLPNLAGDLREFEPAISPRFDHIRTLHSLDNVKTYSVVYTRHLRPAAGVKQGQAAQTYKNRVARHCNRTKNSVSRWNAAIISNVCTTHSEEKNPNIGPTLPENSIDKDLVIG